MPMTTLLKPLTVEKVYFIPGPVGQLEALIATQQERPSRTWGIICHPHPLQGGTMYNKVVTTVVKTFQAMGINTVRFNFRGVKQSAGQFDHGQGECDDLLAVMQWVKQTYSAQDFWLAGFSFGSYVAAYGAAHERTVAKLITIAPPVTRLPFATLPPITCQWILVQGEQDEVVSADAVFAWARSRHPQPTILRFKEAGHFFHGMLQLLHTQLMAILSKQK